MFSVWSMIMCWTGGFKESMHCCCWMMSDTPLVQCNMKHYKIF